MTIFTDSATIKSVTTPSAALEIHGIAYFDADTPSGVTSISAVEELWQDADTPAGVTSLSSMDDIAAFVDAATVPGVTSLDQSFMTEAFTLHTSDYSWNPWNVTVTSGGYATAGSVGGFDNDHGQIT